MNNNISSDGKKYLERVKLYADTPTAKNVFFCWKLNSLLDLQACLFRHFGYGWNVRAAYYEKIDLHTGEILENTKINLQEQKDLYYEKRRLQLLSK